VVHYLRAPFKMTSQRIPLLAAKLMILFAVVMNERGWCQSEAVQHFRWSERRAHELSYEHTASNAGELTPKERTALITFLLDRFKHPTSSHDADMFEGIPDEEMRKLAAQTRIELADLNGDSKKEIIAQGNGLGPCGGTGNCIVLVMRTTQKGFELLLDSRAGEYGGGFEKIRVLETATSGFRDIVLASHVSASDRTLEVFRFTGGKYRRSACYYSTLMPAGYPEGLKQPEISRGCPE